MYSQKQNTMSTKTTTLDRVRNYQGQNRFLNNLKDSAKKYSGLTVNQIIAAEKCLNSETKVRSEEHTSELQSH